MKIRNKVRAVACAAAILTGSVATAIPAAAYTDTSVQSDGVFAFRLSKPEDGDARFVNNYVNRLVNSDEADESEEALKTELGFSRAGFGAVAKFDIDSLPEASELTASDSIVFSLTTANWWGNDSLNVYVWDDSTTEMFGEGETTAENIYQAVTALSDSELVAEGTVSKVDLTANWGKVVAAADENGEVELFIDNVNSNTSGKYYISGASRPTITLNKQIATVTAGANTTVTTVSQNGSAITADGGNYAIEDGDVTATFTAASGYYFKTNSNSETPAANNTTAEVTVTAANGADVAITGPDAFLPVCKVVRGNDEYYYPSINDAAYAIEPGDTIVLLQDAEVGPDRLNLRYDCTVTSGEGGPYSITPSDEFNRGQLILVCGPIKNIDEETGAVTGFYSANVTFDNVNIDSESEDVVAIEFKGSATMTLQDTAISGDVYSQSGNNKLYVKDGVTVDNGIIKSRSFKDGAADPMSWLHVYDETYTNIGNDTESKIADKVYLIFDSNDKLYGPGNTTTAREFVSNGYFTMNLIETGHRTTAIEGVEDYKNNASPFICTIASFPKDRMLTYTYDKSQSSTTGEMEYTNEHVTAGELEDMTISSVKFTAGGQTLTRTLKTKIAPGSSFQFAVILTGTDFGSNYSGDIANSSDSSNPVQVVALP